MPRPWIEIVHDFPALLATVWYLLRVLAVEKNRDPPGISVSFEHLDNEHTGRRHSVLLPLPIRPSGLTADFFKVCGVSIAPDGRINPKDAVGRVIEARFDPATNQPIEFKEPIDERKHQTAQLTSEAPGKQKQP